VVFATHALSPAKVSRISIVAAAERHMEVIVDDSQLSLAIGKKGQNVRLAAKLLGWKIDIKSEEEKRQEVESQMAALVSPGAPVSVLIDYGLPENIVETLVAAGVGTIDQLGSMTPEQIEEIPGFGPDMVESIQQYVNAYYGQFEDEDAGQASRPVSAEAPAEAQAGEEITAAVADAEEEGMPAPGSAGGLAAGDAAGLAPGDAASEEAGSAGGLAAGEAAESVETEESATIENAGFPGHNQSETDATEKHTGE
jgi:N utilization substance protein A